MNLWNLVSLWYENYQHENVVKISNPTLCIINMIHLNLKKNINASLLESIFMCIRVMCIVISVYQILMYNTRCKWLFEHIVLIFLECQLHECNKVNYWLCSIPYCVWFNYVSHTLKYYNCLYKIFSCACVCFFSIYRSTSWIWWNNHKINHDK